MGFGQGTRKIHGHARTFDFADIQPSGWKAIWHVSKEFIRFHSHRSTAVDLWVSRCRSKGLFQSHLEGFFERCVCCLSCVHDDPEPEGCERWTFGTREQLLSTSLVRNCVCWWYFTDRHDQRRDGEVDGSAIQLSPEKILDRLQSRNPSSALVIGFDLPSVLDHGRRLCVP